MKFIEIAKMVSPDKLLRYLDGKWHEKERERRIIAESKIPQYKLDNKKIDNCEVVLDRKELLKELGKGGVVAEVGVAEGEFSSKIAEICDPEKMHLIDIWDSERYDDTMETEVKQRFRKEIEKGEVVINKGRSTEVVELFDDNYFDWIYIDSDHSYETTIKELRKFSDKVKKGGIIAGHDYERVNWIKMYRYGVIEAVHEFCSKNMWDVRYLTVDSTENRSFAIKKNV